MAAAQAGITANHTSWTTPQICRTLLRLESQNLNFNTMYRLFHQTNQLLQPLVVPRNGANQTTEVGRSEH